MHDSSTKAGEIISSHITQGFYKRSDGFVETVDRNFAVVMVREGTLLPDGNRLFNFHTCPSCPETRLLWPDGHNIIFVKADLATTLTRLGFATHPTNEQVQEMNDEVGGLKVSATTETKAEVDVIQGMALETVEPVVVKEETPVNDPPVAPPVEEKPLPKGKTVPLPKAPASPPPKPGDVPNPAEAAGITKPWLKTPPEGEKT